MGRAADRHVQPDGNHQVFKHLPIFTAFNGLGIGANHLEVILLERSRAVQGHRGVEGGLAAQRGQEDKFGGRSLTERCSLFLESGILTYAAEALHFFDFS